MGIDVGVVRISYLQRPGQPTYNFLWWLATHAGYDGWGGGWDENAFIEIERRQLLSNARAYAQQGGISPYDLQQLLSWVRGLPWDDNTIMLHFNW
jgi:hypothetical protein